MAHRPERARSARRPTGEVADACRGDDRSEPRADCVETLAWSDACDPDWRASSGGVTHDGLISEDIGDGPYSHAAIHTITDADTWADYVAAAWPEGSPDLPVVDLAENIVVIAQFST